ncbi:unnamed protein product, partial [Adineta steineri]
MYSDQYNTIENPTSLPSSTYFQEYYLQDENRVQKLLDILFDPHQSLPEIIQKYLTILKSYLSGRQSFEGFCKELQKYDNSILCGCVWTNSTISYRCRTCAINPCMSLCSDCFYAGNHDKHDANMFRSIGGGVCDCGDIEVMNSNGFCKSHGPNRIPNESIPLKLIQSSQIILPRLLLIYYIVFFLVSITAECCICQSKDDQNPLGLVVRLSDSGVLGIREVSSTPDNYLPLSIDDNNKSSLNDPLICCQFNLKRNGKEYLSTEKQIEESNRTCAQFYEEKIRTMLEMFTEESVSESMTISWRTGIIITSCGHSMHLSCYKEYFKSHTKKTASENDPHIEFKCPMCRQKSNGLIYIPQIDTQIESNENLIETISNLIEKNIKICIFPLIAEWLTNFIEKIYLMVNKNYRTIDKQIKQPSDDILALFLTSILRFNLENDILIRDTPFIDSTIINRKSCFRELFYICNLKYPYLLNHSHILLWHRIATGHMNTKLNNNEQTVPLLLSDSVVLLLRIMLSLPYLITRELYRVIVQVLFNLTYIQALFTIISEMNKTEQEIWSRISVDKNKNNMSEYLRMISSKLFQSNFNSNIDNTKISSLESINALIRERCGNFIKIAALIQHYLYQSITWWIPDHHLHFDHLSKNLIKELKLYNNDEPYWFSNDSLLIINNWLDEVLTVDKQQSILKIIHAIPVFHSPQFIELPTCYSDLFRSCNHRRCSYCQELIIEPILCLICGIVYSQERT